MNTAQYVNNKVLCLRFSTPEAVNVVFKKVSEVRLPGLNPIYAG
jgi:hypothetical protein